VFRWGPPRPCPCMDRCFFRYTLHLFSLLLSHTKFISSSMQTKRNSTSVVPLSPSSYTHDMSTLQSCLDSLLIWFCENGMTLSASKSVVILFGTYIDSNLCLVSNLSMSLGQSFQFRIRSIYLVQHLIPTSQMEPDTKTLPSSCFYHIRSLKQIRSSLDDSMDGSVASSLVSSRLDYVNSILYG